MAKKNDTNQYAPDTQHLEQTASNTLAIGIMQERFKNVESSIEEMKLDQKSMKVDQQAGFTKIENMLGNAYVTTQQHERLIDKVAVLEKKLEEQNDIMKLVRNIVITAIVVGILALLGLKTL